jgi:hypothetical protein
MISFDQVRAAVQADQPWTELDNLVRSEMASGRSTKQIFDELHGMLGKLDDMKDVSEDGMDAFGDTLDALTGHCHKDCQYKDPPNNTLPSEEEIGHLPRWARVAFAARCARTVLPLFEFQLPQSSPENFEALSHAVELAETSSIDIDGMVSRSRLNDAENDAVVIAGSVGDFPRAVLVARAVARAVMVAVEAYPIAYQYADTSRVWDTVINAAQAAGTGIVRTIRRDFDHLLGLSNYFHWTDDTPVPPEVFGPLWPEGPPKGWPPITDIPQRTGLSLSFFSRERAVPKMLEDDVVNLFNAINRYHIARGGVPLTYDDLRALIPAEVVAEV